jgi:hypothetical protein
MVKHSPQQRGVALAEGQRSISGHGAVINIRFIHAGCTLWQRIVPWLEKLSRTPG